jgi:hypothetical protein
MSLTSHFVVGSVTRVGIISHHLEVFPSECGSGALPCQYPLFSPAGTQWRGEEKNELS